MQGDNTLFGLWVCAPCVMYRMHEQTCGMLYAALILPAIVDGHRTALLVSLLCHCAGVWCAQQRPSV